VSAVADGTQEIRRLVRREHAYLIDEEAIEMATRAGTYIVPTMQMTPEDLGERRAGTLPDQAVWKFRRDNRRILEAQRTTSPPRPRWTLLYALAPCTAERWAGSPVVTSRSWLRVRWVR
jgi:hypothetical protein